MTEFDVVIVQGVPRTHGPGVVVGRLGFDVRPGEIAGLADADGAGKTTAVERVQGLRRPGGGAFSVPGCDRVTGAAGTAAAVPCARAARPPGADVMNAAGNQDSRVAGAVPGGGASEGGVAIRVRGLRKRYGDVEAVRGIDLTVRTGEIFAFLGPNGAGKTTTVETLEGYRRRDAGEVDVLGSDPARPAAGWRARIGVVLQESQPEAELTVEECVSLYAGYYPRPQPAAETLELVGLADRRSARCGRLSGGQRRRLDVALALIGDPELVFLDEPTTGFDPAARQSAWEVIAGLRDLGKTIFLTTHYMEEAERLADRIAVIAAGRLVAEGTPAGLGGRDAEASVLSFTLPPGVPAADLAITAVLLAIGWAAFAAHIPGRTGAAFLLDIIVGAVAFCCLGFAVASLIGNIDAAQPVTLAIVLPLCFLSGVFIPIMELPRWLIDVGKIFPVHALADALLAAYNPHTTGSGLRWGDLAVLAAWGAAGLIIAVRRFSWLPRAG